MEELIDTVAETTIHTKHKKAQFLMTEVYKSHLSPGYNMSKFFQIKKYKLELRPKMSLDIPSAYVMTFDFFSPFDCDRMKQTGSGLSYFRTFHQFPG